jgi:hypothetical protein
VDHYEEAVVEMIKKKQAGMPVSREHAAPRPQNVVNLMDALRRSMAQEKAASAPHKKGRNNHRKNFQIPLKPFCMHRITTRWMLELILLNPPNFTSSTRARVDVLLERDSS